MSRKHNTRHPQRGRSLYPGRLEARGLSRSPKLTALDSLIARQDCNVCGSHLLLTYHAPGCRKATGQ